MYNGSEFWQMIAIRIINTALYYNIKFDMVINYIFNLCFRMKSKSSLDKIEKTLKSNKKKTIIL